MHFSLVSDSAVVEPRWFNHVAANAGRCRQVARIDSEAAPNVRRVLDVFFAEQVLAVVATQQEGEPVQGRCAARPGHIPGWPTQPAS